MKSILVPILNDDGQEARLQAALDLARAYDAHLTCLQIAPLDQFASIEPYGVSYLLTQSVSQIREMQEEEKAQFEKRLAGEGVEWNWISRAGTAGGVTADMSWLSDLIVMSLPDRSKPIRDEFVPEDVVVGTRCPVLAMPESTRGFDCTGKYLISWNGSPEASAAVKSSLQLLRRASGIKIVTVEEDSSYDLPSIEAARYLARHGLEAEVEELAKGSSPVSDMLLDAAFSYGASCLVMGAYGHSRLRENIFGGVTKGMLTKAKIPLLIAH